MVGSARVGALVAALLWAGCGDDAASPADGGRSDAARADSGTAPELPRIDWLELGVPPVAPPALDCPAGWRVDVSESGVETCDAYAEAGPATCAAGEAHFPGEPDCAPIGDPCPASGDWPTDLPTDRPVVYVRSGATGGDGSMARPYATIGQALASVASPVTIALARGRHLMPAAFPATNDVSIVGVCVAETTIENDAVELLLTLYGTGYEIRNLTLLGAGIALSGTVLHTEALIEGVEVRMGRGAGLAIIDDAHATVRSFVVRGTRGALSDGGNGSGVFLMGSGSLALSRAVLEDNHVAGVWVDGASATIEDVAVRRTAFQTTDGAEGHGISVRGGGTAHVARAVLEENAWSSATAMGSTVELEDVVCRGVAGRASDGRGGGGIASGDGPSLTVRRATIERFTNFGLVAGSGVGGGSVLVEDVVLRDARPSVAENVPVALEMDIGLTATVSRARLSNVNGVGVIAFSTLDASDVTVDGMLEHGAGIEGIGVVAGEGSRFTLTRAAIRGSATYGAIAQFGADLTLTDVLVADTEGRSVDGRAGQGLAVLERAAVHAERLVLLRNRGGALVSDEGSTADFADLVVRDSRPEAATNDYGRGLTVQVGATATVERALLERNLDVGVSVLSDSHVTARDLVLRDTMATACGTECALWAGGVGLGIYAGASIEVRDFVIERSVVCGVQLADGAAVDLYDGEISGSEVGACVQVDGYDLGRLQNGVVYRDNGTNLDVTNLPVPTVMGL